MNYQRKPDQQYDYWLHWGTTERCNLECSYCTQIDNPTKSTAGSPPIDIEAVLKTFDKVGGTFRLSFVGGEPFLTPNIVEACEAISKKHYLSFNTNLTSKRVVQFAERVDPDRVLFIVASLHIKELERTGQTERYIKHYLACKEKGFVIMAAVVAHPSLFPDLDKYRRFFESEGVTLVFDPCLGDYEGKDYPQSYTPEELDNLGLDSADVKSFFPKGSLCNAGHTAGVVEANGNVRVCVNIFKSIGNIYDEINFNPGLVECPYDLCGCPINYVDPYLAEKSIKGGDEKVMGSMYLARDKLKRFAKKQILSKLPRGMRARMARLAKKLHF